MDSLLLETGDYLLIEVGDHLLLESAGGGISIPVVYHHRQRNF